MYIYVYLYICVYIYMCILIYIHVHDCAMCYYRQVCSEKIVTRQESTQQRAFHAYEYLAF